MQYGNYFPATYQNMYQQYQQSGFNNPGQQMQSSPMQAQNNQPPVSMMGGFIPVQSENEARAYRLSPGTSATFIDENAPYCYTKTEGVSQLDRPIFKRFRLVEEPDMPQSVTQGSQRGVPNDGIDLGAYALKADMDALAARISELQAQFKKLSAKEDTGA